MELQPFDSAQGGCVSSDDKSKIDDISALRGVEGCIIEELGMEEAKEEIKVLSHEPWPGYRKAFYIIFSIGIIYLAIILIQTL